MTTITANAFAPAQDLDALIAGLDFNDENLGLEFLPDGAIGLNFSNGVSLELGAVIGEEGITINFLRASENGTLLLDVPTIGLRVDNDLNPVNLDEFDRFELNFTDADDIASGDVVSGGIASYIPPELAALFPEIPDVSGIEAVVDFAGGTDSLVFDIPRAELTQSVQADGTVRFEAGGDAVTAANLERAETTDGVFLYGVEHDRTEFVYGLYAASLNRTPDESGFVFWNNVATDSAYTDEDLANFFVESPEFATLFDGEITDELFINQLYTVVLDRPADQAGYDFWLGVFQTGEYTRAGMLNFFVESPENFAGFEADVADGIWVLPDEMV